MPTALFRLALLGTLAAAATCATAAEVYGGGGLPGVMLGFAQPIDTRFGVHGDVSSLGTRDIDVDQDGTHYDGHFKWNRLGLFGDWFPWQGGFRLTGGVTVNDLQADLTANGAGRSVTVNGKTVVLTQLDRVDATVTYPTTQPYVGIGWGHHADTAGWGLWADLGASFGKPKVHGVASGPTFSAAGITQQDVDVELQAVRDNVGKVSALPQISIGVRYTF